MKTIQWYLPEHEACPTQEFILSVSPETEAGTVPTDSEDRSKVQETEIQELPPELFVTDEVDNKANPATTAV